MLRILLITFDTPAHVGGIESRAVHYSKELRLMGHDVLLLILSNLSAARISVSGAKVVILPSESQKVIMSILKAIRLTVSFRADSIFFLTGGTTLFGLLLILLTSGCIRSGIFIYGKDILSAKKRLSTRLLFKSAIAVSQWIGVNSKATASLLPDWTASKVRLLFPGVDVNILNSSTIVQKKIKRKVLFVGRLVPRKGADDLIKAFHLLLMDLPETELEIIGEGSEIDSLKFLANRLDIASKVHFLGELSGKPLYLKYAECSVFCMPSKRLKYDVEGFGIVFLEAALFGKPSVGTWSGGIPEAVIHNQTGILVNEGDISGLRDALKTLLLDRQLAQRLGLNAQCRVVEMFGWKKVTERLLELL